MTAQSDCVIVGGGHNGLVAACYLAMAGRSVTVLEARPVLGGASISAKVFEGVDARLSKYSYLISLLPRQIREELGIELTTIRRGISSYTPDPADPERGLAISIDYDDTLDDEMTRLTGSAKDADAWRAFYERTTRVAERVFPTLTQPLMTRRQMQDLVDNDADWSDFFERPLGEILERTFDDDVVRGIVLTDGLIGTFAGAHDVSLHQNICFLYHVIGNGTGDWDVPVGGMGALVEALTKRATELGVDIRTSAPVTSITSDGEHATVTAMVDGQEMEFTCTDVLVNAAPAILDRLLDRPSQPVVSDLHGGAQVKVNMLLSRLPRLKDSKVDPRDAFAGTFHINESYTQLERAFREASAGRLPSPIPAEIYCHSLTDATILSEELREAGAQTLTVFALHAPHSLFVNDNAAMRDAALTAVVASLNSVLAEPIEDCLWRDASGRPCIEVNTTVDIEAALAIPTGNIFHTPLDWPFVDDDSLAGTWGVETDLPNVTLCGSGARRGGAVSGIPGHNAARRILSRG